LIHYTQRRVTNRRKFIYGAALFVAYVAAAKFGFRLAFVAEQVTAVWAPTGIALAALLLRGQSLWPAVWLGAFAANATTHAPLWTAVPVATGNTLEAVVASWVLSSGSFDPAFRRIRDAVAFILVAAFSATMISATIGVVTLCAANVQPWTQFQTLWGTWWLGDAIGAIVVGPVILTLARSSRGVRRQAWAETIALVLGTAIVSQFVFGSWLGPSSPHPLEYVIFPFLIAAAFRRTQPATSLVVLAASAVTIWNTVRGSGPFAGTVVHDSLILLQVFLAVVAATGLLLAAAIAERETGERRRAAAHAVAALLSEASSLVEAAPRILRAVTEKLDWATGVLWIVDHQTLQLRCLDAHARSIPPDAAFLEVTREKQFARGVGLPGRVWASGKPAWVENVVDDGNFPRAPQANAAGLHGAFAVPIHSGREIQGVLEFFNRAVASPDADLLETMSSVGHQIGQFVARKQVELAVAESRQRELAARREAEAANHAKDEFLATLSHELRTPLNAIIGWTRMLLDGTLDEPSRVRALQVIDRNSRLQAKLVGDILDVSRIITGGLRLDTRPVDLGSVIGAALDVVRPAAAAKRITLRSRLNARSTIAEGDPHRLQQIVWNLVANAVKFTPEGGTVDVDLSDGDDGGLQISVEDDGAGIDPEFLPHVFDRFRQADGSVSRQHGGLGLGLAIVRHLVELHGGRVGAYSAGSDQGSTFTVSLPRYETSDTTGSADAQNARKPPATVLPLVGCRALIVDDEADARELLATILSAAGAEVRTAASVREALLRVEEARPDILLADIGMPGEDGYALIREIRTKESDGVRLRAAALTAYAGTHDRERALLEGFDWHFAKPIDPAEIIDSIRLVHNRAGTL
jgi:signal transduction histidine kinase/integral membrane sensor domain MASE1